MMTIIGRILLILLFIPSVSFAADFLSTFEDVRIQIRKSLRFDTTSTGGIPDNLVDAFIREGLVVVPPTVVSKRSEQSFVTTYRQNTYSLDSLTIAVLSVQWQKNDTIKSLIRVPQEFWYQQEHKKTKNKEGYERRPSYYDWTDDQIFLYPVPTKTGDTIVVFASEKITDISADTILTDVNPIYRVPIYKYALWKVAAHLQLQSATGLYADYEKAELKVKAALSGGRIVQGN